LLLAIANEYDLPGIEPVVREVVKVAQDDLARFAGRYEVGEWGVSEVAVDGERLKLTHEGSDYSEWWYPQSELEFFDSETGSISTFEVQDGVVIGFTSEAADGIRLLTPA
jgi:hypothetical protein